jgi:MFS family permease
MFLQSWHAASDGSSASAYVAGAVVGALIFGWLTDRFGRRLVFYITLLVYLAGVLLTATSWSFLSFAFFRAVTGLGIGGEYAAINSAIDELIPAKYRGRIDIIVNGRLLARRRCRIWRFTAVSRPPPARTKPWMASRLCGWRLPRPGHFVIAQISASPRWLVTHGYEQ